MNPPDFLGIVAILLAVISLVIQARASLSKGARDRQATQREVRAARLSATVRRMPPNEYDFDSKDTLHVRINNAGPGDAASVTVSGQSRDNPYQILVPVTPLALPVVQARTTHYIEVRALIKKPSWGSVPLAELLLPLDLEVEWDDGSSQDRRREAFSIPTIEMSTSN